MSDIQFRNMFLVAVFAMAILAGCETSNSNPQILDTDVQQADTGDPTEGLIPCETHAECAPAYCVHGFCNGTPAPKTDVNSCPEDVVEDTADISQPDTNLPDTTQPDCTSNEDCSEMGPCYTGTCRWGDCVYEDAGLCNENQTCYETETGYGCANTCQVDADCQNNPCVDAHCDAQGICQYEYDNTNTCDDGDACTTDDACHYGVCAGEQMDCPGGCEAGECQDLCATDADCVTDDPCLNATCTYTENAHAKACNFWYKGEAAACELDGEAGQCYDGQCVVPETGCQDWTDCTDGSVCTQDICNADGTCSNPLFPQALGTQCAPMHICVADGSCSPVECITNEHCNDEDDNSVDLCIANECSYSYPDECNSDNECDDGNECTIDTCNAGVCSNEDECFYGFGFTSLMCNTDADCVGSSFGDYCVESALNGEDLDIASIALCQPCSDELDNACGESGTCVWGATGSQIGLWVSVYQCEDILCQSNADCDDGDPCTSDHCLVTECSHIQQDNCFYCESNSDCESSSWCDEQSGGVFIEYPVCQPDGTCQVDYWASTIDVTAYGCQYPLECESDADCPLGGECYISTCYYTNPSEDFTYPECNMNSQCSDDKPTCWEGKCVECVSGVACNDGDNCTQDVCSDFVCQHNEIADCVTMTICETDADCVDAEAGSFCVSSQAAWPNKLCQACKQDGGEGIDSGCNASMPVCRKEYELPDNHGLEIYSCVQCVVDADCGLGQYCTDNNLCGAVGDIVCQFECPEGDVNWQKVVIWHGDSETTEVNCGEVWTVSSLNLCLWGQQHPVAKFNLTDGVWAWGSGTATTLNCNYENFSVTPDPALSGGPNGETMGDLGVAILEFNDIICGGGSN